MKNVLVSVIIPTYNRAYCIEKSIQSVLNQSYRNIELIIVDDCSKDNTEEVIRNISDSRIVYVKNDKNLGAAASRNRGAQLARGEWLAFNDSDDQWAEKKLQKQLDYLDSLDAKMVYCRFRRSDEVGESISVIPGVEKSADSLNGDIYSLMHEQNVISTQTVVIHRELFLQLNGFKRQMKALEDYELFLRAAKLTKIAFVDEILVESVDYGDGINDATKNALANVKAIVLMAEEFKEDINDLEIPRCFISNLPFFVQHLDQKDWGALRKNELVFVSRVLEKYMGILYGQNQVLQETIQQLNEWHEEKDETIRQLNEWNNEKDRTIQQLNEWHAEKDETIRQLNEWNNEKDKTIQQLNEWHKEKDNTIQQLNEWHWEKDKTIQQLNEWHWEKDRYITELQEKIQKYENQ